METLKLKKINLFEYNKIKDSLADLKMSSSAIINLNNSKTFTSKDVSSKDLLDSLIGIMDKNNKNNILTLLKKSKTNLREQILKVDNLEHRLNKYLDKLFLIYKMQNCSKLYLDNINMIF